VVGYYNRFDIFDLRVNRRRLNPVSFSDDPAPVSEAVEWGDDDGRTTTRIGF
jgi:aliphatic nitrilase